MTAFQRILINTERWNETVVTPSLAKPHELICTPNIILKDLVRYVIINNDFQHIEHNRVDSDDISRGTEWKRSSLS